MASATKTAARETDRLGAPKAYSRVQLLALVVLRVLIGWHFLYEGISKVLSPYWSSANYLLESKGVFSGLFFALVANPTALRVVDFLNAWGLTAIGAGLIAGVCTRMATLAGMMLLLLYYIATPPLTGLVYAIPVEGSYLIVNKNLIEMAALLVLAMFPTGHIVGVDALLFKRELARAAV